MALIITLLFAGAILLLLETVLPGLVAGIGGLICLAAAVVLGYTRFDLPTGHYIAIGTLFGLGCGFALWLRYFPESRAAGWFISHGKTGNIGAEKPELVNRDGTALTSLRPSGTALIDGKRVDVVSEGDYIEQGQNIRVIATEGMRVVVRKT